LAARALPRTRLEEFTALPLAGGEGLANPTPALALHALLAPPQLSPPLSPALLALLVGQQEGHLTHKKYGGVVEVGTA